MNTRAPRRNRLQGEVSDGDHGTLAAQRCVGGARGGETALRRSAELSQRRIPARRYLDRDDTNGYDESSGRLRFHGEALDGGVRPYCDDGGPR